MTGNILNVGQETAENAVLVLFFAPILLAFGAVEVGARSAAGWLVLLQLVCVVGLCLLVGWSQSELEDY